MPTDEDVVLEVGRRGKGKVRCLEQRLTSGDSEKSDTLRKDHEQEQEQGPAECFVWRKRGRGGG